MRNPERGPQTAPVRLPLMQQVDAHLIGYQRDIEEKRSAAFRREVEQAQLRQARADWDPLPQWGPHRRYVPPIRANAPEAGAAGWDWQSPAPRSWRERVDWPEVAGTLVGLLIVAAVGVACFWAACRAIDGSGLWR
jgi:hypothetical protein